MSFRINKEQQETEPEVEVMPINAISSRFLDENDNGGVKFLLS
jgi:hypothetical protein